MSLMRTVLPKPTYYKNLDTSHCVQACLKSIFSITHPKMDFSWQQLEEMTDYIPGHGAWVYAELLALDSYGIDARLISGFNVSRFVTEGFDYIEDEYGKEVADYERDHPHDYEKIKLQMQRASSMGLVEGRSGTNQDIKDFIDTGWYVMVLVNSRALNGKAGYTGHRVLVYGYDDTGVIMHDPGPTHGGEARHVSWQVLDKSWPNAKELIGVKKHSQGN